MKSYLTILLYILSIDSITNAQWFIRNSGTTTNFKDVCYIDPYFLTIVGESGAILRSTNSGFNWFFQPSSTPEHLNSVDFIDPFFGIIVGNIGTILRTTNGGINWEQLNSGTTEILNCISCYDYNNCIAVGGNGTVVKTSDGGNSWIPLQSGTSRSLYGASFTDLNNIFIVGLQTMLKSTNGGADWIINTMGSSYLLRGISCIDSINCFAVGSGAILRTSDGGINWEYQSGGSTHSLSGVSYNNQNYCNTVGSLGVILGTTNSGLEWMTQPGWTNRNLLGVSFINPDSGIAVGNSGVIRMTYTAGIPVEMLSFSASARSGYVELIWETASELNNQIFEIERRDTSNDFLLIGFVDGAGTSTEPQKYSFIDRNVERGIYFYRLKQIDYNGTFEYSNEIEVFALGNLTFSLNQNYPNPFNPSTLISYQLPVISNVTLKVYDILGNEVATLVNEEKQPGVYEVEFDASSLASGLYLYKLQAVSPKGQAFVQTKKMVLLK